MAIRVPMPPPPSMGPPRATNKQYLLERPANPAFITISLLVGSVAAPVMGRLGDGHRRRGVILWSGAIVLVGCTLSAVTNPIIGVPASVAAVNAASSVALVPPDPAPAEIRTRRFPSESTWRGL